jgi:hypothetical protein
MKSVSCFFIVRYFERVSSLALAAFLAAIKAAKAAASNGRLPFVKEMGSQVNLEALRACVRFLQKTLNDSSPRAIALESLHKLEQMKNKYLEEPLTQLRSWTIVALVCVCLGFVLILTGAVGAFFGHLQAGVLTSIASVITSAVAALFYQRLGKLEEPLSKQVQGLRDDIEATLDRVLKLAS